MNPTANTRSYDFFKAVVALILLILLIWLLLNSAPAPAAPIAEAPVATHTPTSAAQAQATLTSPPLEPSPLPTLAATQTSLPTSTPTTAPTPTQAPTETPATSAAQDTPAASETPEPATTTSTAAALTETPVQISSDCPLALPTRLEVGDTVQVISNLNMRIAAGTTSTLILSNPAGSQLTIIGGPVCEPYQSGAYLWWQVRRADEQSGWSAEGSLTDNFYFLEPVE